jgi:hypothetical protein
MRGRPPGAFFALAIVAVALLLLTPTSGVSGDRGSALRLDQGSGDFYVNFTESGLAPGTTWKITIGSQTQSASAPNMVQFVEPNGSYTFTVDSVAGYEASPTSGPVDVAGANTSVGPITYTPVYSVSFSESGLPSGQTWTVTVNSLQKSLTTNGHTDTLTWADLPNGSYPYTISPNAGWSQSTLPYSGSVQVNGGTLTEPTLVYSQVTYSVTFSESGLASGLTWKVTVVGISAKSLTTDGGTDSLVWENVANGSYSYTISPNPGWSQTTLPYSGPLTVSGASVVEPTLMYTQVTYSVTFSESGLQSGLTWKVTVDSVPQSRVTDGGTDSFTWSNLANGTYSYSIAGIAGWEQSTLKYSGSVVVNGASVNEPTLLYSQAQYTLTFSESGLPAGRGWWVVVGGFNKSAISPDAITFSEINGSYSYSVVPIGGWSANTYNGSVQIQGSGATVDITWTQVTYAAWFNESGLPQDYEWGVTFDGILYSSPSTSIALPSVPNGTYPFSIKAVPDYRSSVQSGNLTVDGRSASVTVIFALVVYAVTFYAGGLPNNALWSVDLDGANVSARVPLGISFNLGNGTYNYTVSSMPGYVPYPPGGNVTVEGKARNITITYSQFGYNFTFTETGLRLPVYWAVTVDGKHEGSNTSQITFPELANGSYSFVAGSVLGYSVSPTAGNFLISANSTKTLNINFTSFQFPIEFYASNLSAELNWTVTLDGAPSSAAGNGVIVFLVQNGTYSFTVTPPAYFVPYNDTGYLLFSGNVSMHGRTVIVTVVFKSVPEFAVVFTETGLAPGTGWSVTAGGREVYSSTTSITISLPDGTWSYYLGYVAGFTPASSSGIVTVSGVPQSVAVTFTGGGLTTPGPPSGLSAAEWILVGSVIAAAALIGGALMVRRRRTLEAQGKAPKHAPL